MANFYLRVPHYVAAYFRNKDQMKPIPVGGVIKIETTNPLWQILSCMAHSNNSETIVTSGCFCERQWRRMMRGMPIYTPKCGAEAPKPIAAKEKGETLSDSEVSRLSGIPQRKGEDSGEYLCIRLPEEVFISGRISKTNGQWQLMNAGAFRMIAMMTEEFWRTFFIYIDKEQEWCLANGYDRSVLDSIERFMTRYDIRNSSDNREKMTMKRNYYRKRKTGNFTEEDFVEHGEEGARSRASRAGMLNSL